MPRFHSRLARNETDATANGGGSAFRPAQSPEDRPDRDGSRLNELADQFESGALVLDDAKLQDIFDTAVERFTADRPELDARLEERGLTRTVEVTEDTILVTISGEQGSRSKAITLDLEADTLTKTVNTDPAEGAGASKTVVWSYDEDGLQKSWTRTNPDGETTTGAADADLDDRLLTLTNTDGETETVAFDDIADFDFADFFGIAPPSDTPDVLIA